MMSGALPLSDFQGLARRAAGAGYAGLVVTEAGRTAYLSCAAAALAGVDLDLALEPCEACRIRIGGEVCTLELQVAPQ